MLKSYAHKVLWLAEYLYKTNAAQFPDRYAALRHALFLNNHLLEDVPPESPGIYETQRLPVGADLTRISIQEFGWLNALQRGQTLSADFIASLRHKQRAALLRAIVRGHILVDPHLLLGQIGISYTLDSLARDALAVHPHMPDDFTPAMREKFMAQLSPFRRRAITALLDIAALHHVPMLQTGEVVQYLKEWDTQDRLIIPLLRYTSALQLKTLSPSLRAMLISRQDLSLAWRFALLDALVKLEGVECVHTLERFAQQLSPGSQALLRQHLEAMLNTLQPCADIPPSAPDGLVVAQFMFIGRIGQAGKGDSGGLGVFLASLGDALGDLPGVAHVYTLVLLNAAQATDDPPLSIERTVNHTVLHIPVCCQHGLSQYRMMGQESTIYTALNRLLKVYQVTPDIFHIRYADHGSRAAAQVAHTMGKKVVFTLTADPHRRLTSDFPESWVRGLMAKALTFDLHKVYLADQLLEIADGIVAMPTGTGATPLKAYFPQLVLNPKIRSKPLRLIAEGIQLLQDTGLTPLSYEELRELLCSSSACRPGCRLDKSLEEQPLILSVGRLHPVKQQHLLVQAWAESGLWQHYNLVLIGGNFDKPSKVELHIQERIYATFDHYPQAQGHFCFLPAMPNTQVRLLEQAIIRWLPAPRPHSYVCSSVKEEFGIAVLEAMDAGFLVFGPQAGGLSSYINSGSNGFLMDTHSVENMGQALSETLTSPELSPERLATIAKSGTETVRTRFDIRATATAFVEFYKEIVLLS